MEEVLAVRIEQHTELVSQVPGGVWPKGEGGGGGGTAFVFGRKTRQGREGAHRSPRPHACQPVAVARRR